MAPLLHHAIFSSADCHTVLNMFGPPLLLMESINLLRLSHFAKKSLLISVPLKDICECKNKVYRRYLKNMDTSLWRCELNPVICCLTWCLTNYCENGENNKPNDRNYYFFHFLIYHHIFTPQKIFSSLWILNPMQLPDDDWINQVPCIHEEEKELLASKKSC